MRVIAFVGNPNVGKSTLFNALTGLKQHTGNWCGKTVDVAQGRLDYRGESYTLVDLPGTYCLVGHSPEERLTEAFLRSQESEAVVVVCDATCLERSLILALQVMETCDRVIVCVNLIDEAKRLGISIDADVLRAQLGVPIVLTDASQHEGTDVLMQTIRAVCDGFVPIQPQRIGCGASQTEENAKEFVLRAQKIAENSTLYPQKNGCSFTQKLDALLLHRRFGYVCLLMLLLAVLYLTIEGANYPSQGLQWCFDRLLVRLRSWMEGAPPMVSGLLLDGILATVGRVISVMLPPMAIFFPLFTLLEDLGYLPRVAFLMDESFRKVGTCGKQSLTMCMGFGCNAVGVTGCRIIESVPERKIALLTNAFVPCNGRFAALIVLIGLHLPTDSTVLAASILAACIVLSVAMSLLASWLLRKTCLKGETSGFVLQLPPYRRPRVMQLIVRSLLDRTCKILLRAITVAAPAGVVIWLLGNVQVGSQSLLQSLAGFLDPIAAAFGMNGAILLAFLLSFPANELMLPILMMIIGSTSGFAEAQRAILAGEMSWQVTVCTIVFFLFHWPCATTLWTVYRESRSIKQTLLACALPTTFGLASCFLLRLLLF